MDFGYLLDLAKKNEEYAKEAVIATRNEWPTFSDR